MTISTNCMNQPTLIPSKSPVQFSNIIIQNHVNTQPWFVAFSFLQNDVPYNGSIINVEISDNNHYKNRWIQYESKGLQDNEYIFHNDESTFTLPISVRITIKQNNLTQTIIACNIIYVFTANKQFNFDNFRNCSSVNTTNSTTNTHVNPTTNPTTNSTTNSTTNNTVNPVYSHMFEIEYRFDKLTQNNCYQILNGYAIFYDIPLILERSYIETSKLYFKSKEELHHRTFEIIMTQQQIIETSNNSMLLPSIIQCQTINICNIIQFLSFESDEYVFINQTTVEFRKFFKNNELIFSTVVKESKQPKSVYRFVYDWPFIIVTILIGICLCAIIGISIFGFYFRKNYMNAFEVKDALVLIIGISKFENKELNNLPGVVQNVIDLKRLWSAQYNYDVFVCKNNLQCTKADIIDFIDIHKHKLENKKYNSVIIHIFSHGSKNGKCFLSSDDKSVEIDFIRHELITEAEFVDHQSLIKLMFNHICQGSNDYSVQNGTNNIPRTSIIKHNSLDNNNNIISSYDSNVMILSGNISGRAMSDKGDFTKCICYVFGKNAKRRIKHYFSENKTEIGRMLEKETDNAEILTVNEDSLRFYPIRFEKCGQIKNYDLKQSRNEVRNEGKSYILTGSTETEMVPVYCMSDEEAKIGEETKNLI
eukprot:363841_1